MINKGIFLKVGKIMSISIFLLIFIYLLLVILSIIARFELDGLDFLFNFRGEIYNPPEEIVIVDIDEKSLKELGRFGEWPRSYYAKVIDYINTDGAKVIGFDILFSEESKIFPEGDKELAEATRRAKNVCHSFMFSRYVEPEKGEKPIDPELSKFSWRKVYPLCSNSVRMKYLSPIKPILKEAHGIGYLNVIHDNDGVVRRIKPLTKYKDGVYPCFALQIACNYLGIKKEMIKIIPGKSIFLNKIRIPIDFNNQMFINYKISSFRYIPFSSVLKKEIPKSFFKDKIVLIGGTAEGLFDNVATPISPRMPGVDVQANIVYSIIKNDFISSPPITIAFFIYFGLSVIIGFILLYLPLSKGLPLTSILTIGYVIINLLLFNFKGIYLEIVRPTMVFISIQVFFLATKAIVAEIKKK